ncbi:hypothetical protein EHQ19_00100 [Leptospira montravelensis]|uniref:LA_2444/LA_4059 family outer membrane protein n=1 Tax=Leptospira montravelensis TaxID=2484961 RepID=UPI00108453B4|nr:LA_2444/LA_4059 family outer membrane protein [Leptospira montravelensis]TGK87180.1 hypothetical protein EHQ19_00100 [Leptospira montravelensis]
MKKITLTITIFLLNSVINAQTSKPTFETGIRVQKAEFIPYDYSRNVTDAEPFPNVKIQNLRNNTKTINPFFLIYKDLQRGFSIEFDYSKIQIERPNFDNEFLSGNRFYKFKNYLANNERSDIKLNFFFYPSQQLNEYFSFGIGIRKIDRIRNASEYYYSIEEKILSMGPQFVVKSKIPINEKISLNLGLDLYHTQGQRNYNYSNSHYSPEGNYSFLETVKGNGKTIGIFQGYEANVSLKYNFLENFNLAFGYNYNYSYFKYQNLDDYTYYFNFSSASSDYATRNTKYSNGKEIIKGFYISASTVF